MKRLILLAVLVLVAQRHFDKVCNSYGFDKGSFITTQGVFCERTVKDSYTTAYLPLSGARLEFGWKNQPPPLPTDGKSPQG